METEHSYKFDRAQQAGETSGVARMTVQIGTVTAVSGYRLSCQLVDSVSESGSNHAYSSVQIGDLIKISTPTTKAFGFIDRVEFERPSNGGEDRGPARADIDLLGEVQASGGVAKENFVRGITVYPVLGAPVFEASKEDVSMIYGEPGANALAMGALHQFPDIPACLKPEDFFSKHFAIMGNSGSGKSCAVALILRTLLSTHRNGHVLILDPHGEYGSAFQDLAENITPENLRLPYWLFGFEEITEVLCSKDETERNRETVILKEAIVHSKKRFLEEHDSEGDPSVDTPSPYQIEDVIDHIDEAMGKLLRVDTAQPYLRLIKTIRDLMQDPRFHFMFDGKLVQDEMIDILSRIFRVPVDGRPVTVLDLSAVPSELVNVVVSLLCRLVFDFAVRSDRNDLIPILVVCEEAHRYIPGDRSLGFEPARRAVTRFALEGRKYGISLCSVTQRPSDLSESILAQSGTVIALRMTNKRDQDFVFSLLPDAAAGLLSALPTLGTQEAVIVGEGVVHPMRIRLKDLEYEQRPRLSPTNFPGAWDEDTKDQAYLTKIVKRWRGW